MRLAVVQAVEVPPLVRREAREEIFERNLRHNIVGRAAVDSVHGHALLLRLGDSDIELKSHSIARKLAICEKIATPFSRHASN